MYDFPPYRPPSEADSALIRVTRGCPWNRCTFCGMYKNQKFQLRSIDEIKEDLEKMPEIFPGSSRIFIADSDSLVHKDIHKIVDLIAKSLPGVERMTSYARAHTLVRKSMDKLLALRKAGLTRLHIGLESGDPSILTDISKGVSPQIMIEGGKKAKKAGFEVCFYVLCGIGGENKWQQHADNTARIINAVNPDFVRLRTLSLVPDSPLFQSWKSGEFVPITPLTRLKETSRIVKKLHKFQGMLLSDHLTNQLWSSLGIIYNGINGRFPKDQGKMLEILQKAINKVADSTDILDAHTLLQKGIIKNL